MLMGDIFHLYKMNPRSAFEGGFRWLYDSSCVFCTVGGRRKGVYNGGVRLLYSGPLGIVRGEIAHDFQSCAKD